MLSADTIGSDLVHRGQEVIIHLSSKDWNRNALESRCWKLASEGFRNVLALSGDYPVSGYHGQSAPVFDIDAVGLLQLLSEVPGGHFVAGAVVTNYKRL
jgi:methylenetetrahydrofolate reductase (NADPH)